MIESFYIVENNDKYNINKYNNILLGNKEMDPAEPYTSSRRPNTSGGNNRPGSSTALLNSDVSKVSLVRNYYL